MKNLPTQTPEPQFTPQVAKPKHKFNGYTLKQLEYQRTIVQLKREFYKERLTNNFDRLTHGASLKTFTGGASKAEDGTKGGSIFSKMFSNLDFFDYASMGITAIKGVSKIISIFKMF